jgi:hypothetical protein
MGYADIGEGLDMQLKVVLHLERCVVRMVRRWCSGTQAYSWA